MSRTKQKGRRGRAKLQRRQRARPSQKLDHPAPPAIETVQVEPPEFEIKDDSLLMMVPPSTVVTAIHCMLDAKREADVFHAINSLLNSEISDTKIDLGSGLLVRALERDWLATARCLIDAGTCLTPKGVEQLLTSFLSGPWHSHTLPSWVGLVDTNVMLTLSDIIRVAIRAQRQLAQEQPSPDAVAMGGQDGVTRLREMGNRCRLLIEWILPRIQERQPQVLHLAVEAGWASVVGLLLSRGWKATMRFEQKTPMLVAISQRPFVEDIADLLLRHGASLTTLVRPAVEGDHHDALRWLLHNGADSTNGVSRVSGGANP